MWRRSAGLALALALLCGCAGGPQVTVPAQENRLIVYTSHKEQVFGPIVQEFEARTGIWVEVVTGGTNDLLERITAQTDAPPCDVMFGGGVESLEACGGAFEPHLCADADFLRPNARPSGDLWTPFSTLPIVLIYNTKLVPTGAISGWGDLLDARWRGRVAFADPAVSGSSYTALVTLLSCLPGDDRANLARFAANLDGAILDDSGEVAQRVADGTCYVGVTLEETALKWVAQRGDVAMVYPKEGTSAVPDGCALVRKAPHRENAILFLEFVQGRDVQELVVSGLSRRSVRTDVAEAPALIPEAELAIIDYDVGGAADGKAALLEQWAELCREAAP